ncbi:MAG: hypothetical protein ABSF26_13740 [Thermoguttaceae bacterium]|jgi:hypothetical protein
MDEVHEEFKRAWAVDHTMTGDRLNWPKGAWPYEGGGYWFDGLVRLGYILHDDALIQQAKRRLGVVVTHMNPNGILFLWWLNKNNPDDAKAITCDGGWPIWASGLLGRALAAYYAGSGDRPVLQTLEAAYKGDRNWVRLGGGMSSVWPAFQTYTWTGNKEIAEALTMLFSKDGGGKGTSRGAWDRYRRMPNEKPGAEANEHGVMFLEGTTPWALGYLWTGNREFLDATIAWYDLLERVAMQPSGVPVADEYYGPTGAFRGTETCDVAGYLWSQIVLALLWPAAFRPADSGHPRPEHARSGRQVELCTGRARREAGARHRRGASGDARQMGLAAGIAAEAEGQRYSYRLEPGAQGASSAVRTDRETGAA